MPPEESTYPLDWLRIAERDLGRVDRCLRDNDPEAAGFFLQQALEKFLKAFLLSRGWRLRRLHDLEVLLDDAAEYDPDVERFRPTCRQVTNYYLTERYPLAEVASPSEEEVSNALGPAQELVEKIRQAITQ